MGWLKLPKLPSFTRYVPFTDAGKHTLVYLVFAGAGPALTIAHLWAMRVIRDWDGAPPIVRLHLFYYLAMLIGLDLLIIVTGIAMFVSIRAVKVKAGAAEFTASGGGSPVDGAGAPGGQNGDGG